MKDSVIKDKILKLIIEDEINISGKISEKLKIDPAVIRALLKQMAAQNHIKLDVATETNLGIIKLDEGVHFYNTSSYRKKAIQKWLEDVPKRYWLISGVFSVIVFALPLYLQYCNKQTQILNREEPLKETPISDTLTVYPK